MIFRQSVGEEGMRQGKFEVDYHTLLALGAFLINSALFIAFFDPVIQGYGDAERGWRQFNALLPAHSVFFWGPHNQIELRIYMVIVTLAILLALYLARLIDRPVLITYLALPAAAYLATKLKVEFLFFPFAIISTRLGWRREVMVLLGLVTLSEAFGENNGYVILFYRVVLIALRWIQPRAWVIVAGAMLIVFLDYNIDLLKPIIPKIAAYDWTRDIVNPEYSIAETVVVFLSSMVLSINPTADFLIGLPATFIVMGLIFGRRLMSFRSWSEWLATPGFRAAFLTILTFTSFTHVFQNARYYFFYLPVFTGIGGERANTVLLIVSVPITCIMTVFYKLVLGM